MPESEANKIAKNYHTDIPFANQGGFFVQGTNNLDWGMKERLAHIFNPRSGRTVIFAFDHGCYMGAAGLERLDLLVPKLIPNVDALLCSRGALRTCVPPDCRKAVILRCGSVPDEDRAYKVSASDIEDAVRLNADCIAVQYMYADGAADGMDNLMQAVNFGMRCGMPVMGVLIVNKGVEKTARTVKLAVRMLAEFGANIVAAGYCEEFEEVCAACPVPVVVTGGKKVSEDEALALAYKAVAAGACGVAFGRNIFQSTFPVEMASALGKIVHEGFTDREACSSFRS